MPLPDPEAVAEAVFAALAEPARRSILSALAARGPTTATGLAGLLPISRQAIAKHLELLAAAGLVLAEPGERRRIRYRVNAAPMTIAQSYLAALARDWDSKLVRLQRSLDAPAPQPEPAAPDPAVPEGDLTRLDRPVGTMDTQRKKTMLAELTAHMSLDLNRKVDISQ